MALDRPVLRRAVLSLAVGAAAAGLAVPSVALPAHSGRELYDARWVAAATHAAWRQFGDPTYPAPPAPPPTHRAEAWVPHAAGAPQTINLDFGPYGIPGGPDLSRVDFRPAGATGYTTETH